MDIFTIENILDRTYKTYVTFITIYTGHIDDIKQIS